MRHGSPAYSRPSSYASNSKTGKQLSISEFAQKSIRPADVSSRPRPDSGSDAQRHAISVISKPNISPVVGRASPTKRNIHRQPKASPGSASSVQSPSAAQRDPSLPRDVTDFLAACDISITAAGKPNKSLMLSILEGTPAARFFSPSGDGYLTRTAPIHNFTLEQLGLSHDIWRHLNRKDRDLIIPGPGQQRKFGRPKHEKRPEPSNEQAQTATRDGVAAFRGVSGSTSDDNAADGDVDVDRVLDRANRDVSRVALSSPPLTNPPLLPQWQSGDIPLAQQTALLVANVERAKLQAPMRQGDPWQPEEDQLLIHLKEVAQLQWQDIGPYFSYRSTSWYTAQARYSGKLAKRALPAQTANPAERMNEDTFANTDDETLPNPTLQEPQTRKSTRRQGTRPDVSYVAKDYFRKVLLGQVPEDRGVSGDEEIQPSSIARGVVRRSVHGAPIFYERHASQTSLCTSAVVPSSQTGFSRDRVIMEQHRDVAALSGGLSRIRRKLQIVEASHSNLPLHLPVKGRDHRQRSITVNRPYLGANELRTLIESTKYDVWADEELAKWDGTALHVDFADDEVEALHDLIQEIVYRSGSEYWDSATAVPCGLLPRQSIGAFLDVSIRQGTSLEPSLIEQRIKHVVSRYQMLGGNLNRSPASQEHFLRDTWIAWSSRKEVKDNSQLLWMKRMETTFSVHRGLRHRELGSRKGQCILRHGILDSLGPMLTFTGASSDINTVAWSPGGSTFAVGSATLTDESSMQYNRPNNLLLGDVERRILRELPHHATQRVFTASGVNSTREMFVSQDPLLFQSVSSVAFSPDAMFSVGFDRVARVYDVRNGVDGCTLRRQIRHSAEIDLLAVNVDRRLFATGSRTSRKAVRVFREDLDGDVNNPALQASFTSTRSFKTPDQQIFPSSLKWGHTIYHQSKYLLCGFSSSKKDFGEGETRLWNIEAEFAEATVKGTRNVFDVAWSPSIFGRFAVASTAQAGVNRGTQSVIQIFDSRFINGNLKVDGHCNYELECPALDINDVIFNPGDDSLISVGCTDGSTYLWDLRMHNQILHQFEHGNPLLEPDESLSREQFDTGVRFLQWDSGRRYLFTGSSDGVVAKWDPYLATEDAHLRNITQLKSGVMCGAFNNDYSRLLLGEVNGSINVLAVGRDEEDQSEGFQLCQADDDTLDSVYRALRFQREPPASENHTAPAMELLKSQQIQLMPFGDLPIRQAVQGSAYNGPFDTGPDSDELRRKALMFQEKSRPSHSPCVCQTGCLTVTEEETGDNGDWKKNIPANVRFEKEYTFPVPCMRCSRPTECGQSEDEFKCRNCRKTWRQDLLGYTDLDVPLLEGPFEQALTSSSKPNPDELIMEFQRTEQDRIELQDVFEHHHSFWQDRPPSPL